MAKQRLSVDTNASPEKLLRQWQQRLGVGFARDPLPKGWKAWQEPGPWLSIDREVTKLIDLRRIERANFTEPCPYAFARSCLRWAALRSYALKDEADSLRATYVQALGAFKKQAPKFQAQTKDMINLLRRMVVPDDIFTRLSDANEVVQMTMDALIVSQLRLKELHSFATEQHNLLSQNQGNVDRIEFASTLGECWRRLTGAAPSPNKPFTDFVAAGWDTLHPEDSETEELPWERAVKTACERLGVSASP